MNGPKTPCEYVLLAGIRATRLLTPMISWVFLAQRRLCRRLRMLTCAPRVPSGSFFLTGMKTAKLLVRTPAGMRTCSLLNSNQTGIRATSLFNSRMLRRPRARKFGRRHHSPMNAPKAQCGFAPQTTCTCTHMYLGCMQCLSANDCADMCSRIAQRMCRECAAGFV